MAAPHDKSKQQLERERQAKELQAQRARAMARAYVREKGACDFEVGSWAGI